MTVELNADQVAAVTMLLRSGKTIKEIVKFAELDSLAVTKVARQLDLEPDTKTKRRAKDLYASPAGHTFQEISKLLTGEGFRGDDDAPMHHLTVASWVKNYGWPWGGATNGDYAPERAASTPARSRYTLRLSKAIDAEVNSEAKIAVTAEAAWAELTEDKTRIVQQAIIQAAAKTGVTNLTAVKKRLMETQGEEIKNTRE